MGGNQPHFKPGPTSLSHAEVAELLPEYVALAVTGDTPEQRFPQVAAHLATCASCRANFVELLALTEATYDGQEPQPDTYPTPDLTALRPSPPDESEPRRKWRRADLNYWLVELTADLLALGRPSPLVGLARADDLLYVLHLPRPDDTGPELRVEVYSQPGGATVYLRLTVDLAALDPFDMSGVEVRVAAAGVEPHVALTDAVGTVSISGIPRPALEGLSVSIRAGRST